VLDADSEVAVPLRVRLTLGRAAVQTIADRAGVEVLHIKGNAVDPELREPTGIGSDIDFLVEPTQVGLLDRELRRHGWRVYSTFTWGSPFGHAQTYAHDVWGFADLHRSFPGIRVDAARAFTLLGEKSSIVDFGGTPCRVPGVIEQAAILVLNAARGRDGTDLRRVWQEASSERRGEIEAVIDALDARVAFSAATGDLEAHRHERDYRLWKVVSEGGTRSAEWRARIWAAPTLGRALTILVRAPFVNVEHLAYQLGRQPTRREIFVEFFARPARAVGEMRRARLGKRP
jgi:hypothetical protein